MKIIKLKLHNFGVYAGDNTFDFKGNKPIVLIGGMNGRGKTTFLEAVLLALYGSNSVAFSESRKRSYSQYLRSFVNKGAEDKKCSVELQFEINNGSIEHYQIVRSWDLLSKNTEEEIIAEKDGIYNDFLTKNWAMFVENILPSALSSFFFFDGEKIAEMAVDSTNLQLKSAIRSMLGINILDVLNNDIVRNLRNITKSGAGNKTAEGVQKLRDEKDAAILELDKIDHVIASSQEKIKEDNNKLDSLHQLYNAKGGDAVEKRQEIISEKEALKSSLVAEENKLYELSMRELPLALVKDLLKDIKLQATDEHAETVMHQAVTQLDILLVDFKREYKKDSTASLDFVNYIKEQTQNNQEEIIYELSDQALFQVNALVEGKLDNVCKEAKKILASEKQLQKQLDDRESYLSLDINTKELQDIYKKIKEAEKILIDDQVKLNNFEQKRVTVNSKVMTTMSEFNKYVESYLLTAEMRDKTDRAIKYSNIALSILEKYQCELQKRKTDVLAATITDCYKKLANKKNLIQKIVMDPDTLDIYYISFEGSIVSQDSLSAGEQQLMVISILWALAICSKKKLPVIIDTPLSRLDSFHRTALIKTYFPNAGEQTIILSTDSEIDRSYYELMQNDVGDEFTLKYDEKTKSTSIEEGYLIGA